MIIQRISSNKAASNLYIFNNNNYSQVQKVPVTPVKPVGKLDAGEEKKKPAAIYRGTGDVPGLQASGMKQIDAIKNEYASSDKAEYNTGNMYERQRMAVEGTVLAGMNYDVFA